MTETIHVSTCTKCQQCGQWTNYASDPYHKAREQRAKEAIAAMWQALVEARAGNLGAVKTILEIALREPYTLAIEVTKE